MPSDAEVICEFMEPAKVWSGNVSLHGWWKLDLNRWIPNHTIKSLDRLREVEERLTPHQWQRYESELVESTKHGTKRDEWQIRYDEIHASPAQKIAALASVLRGGSDGR